MTKVEFYRLFDTENESRRRILRMAFLPLYNVFC